jgi:hypothetical protein
MGELTQQQQDALNRAMLNVQRQGALQRVTTPDNRRQPGETVEAYRARLSRTTMATPPGAVEANRQAETMMRQPVDMHSPPVQIGGAYHPQGTMPTEVANVPPGMVYDPRSGQYRDMQAIAAAQDRSATDAAIGGAMQGVGLNAGDEVIGAVSSVLEGPAMGALRREQARATLAQDAQDYPLTQLAGQIGGAFLLPGGVIAKGAGWLKNAANVIGFGMGMGAVDAFNRGEGGVNQRLANVPGGLATGLVAGAVALPVAVALGKVGQSIGNFVRNRALFSNGQLTSRGQRMLADLGIDPAQATAEFQQIFAREAARVTDPADAATVAQMGEFGIPANRANVTGAVEDFAALRRAEVGALGQPAANRVQQAMQQQRDATRAATERIATDFSGGNPMDQADAARGVMEGLGQARDAALNTARGAYQALEAAGGGIRGTAIGEMGSRIANALRMENVRLSDQLTPNARSAVQYLDDVFSQSGRGSVPFMSIENARQALVRMNNAAARGSLGQDQFAMSNLMKVFDQEVDNLMTTAMTEGSDAVLDLARSARSLWSSYARTFTGDGAGSRFIQKMVDADASPDDAVKWLFSAGRLGTGQFNSTIARQVRDVLGPDSEAWSAIRQAAFRQMTQKAEGMVQPGPQAMAQELRRFLNGPTTRELSQTLYSSNELAMMRRFADAVSRMVPPSGAINSSNTAYEISRMGQQLFKAITGSLGFASGGPVGAVTATGAANMVQGARNAIQSRALLNPTIARQAAPSVPVATMLGPVNALTAIAREQFPSLQGQENRQ